MGTKTNRTGIPASPEPRERGAPGTRGTAAGFRAGATSRTEAKRMTSTGGKATMKEQTHRGGPGRAGTQSGTKRVHENKKPTRGRGRKASAGA